jgi:hypothetical protein
MDFGFKGEEFCERPKKGVGLFALVARFLGRKGGKGFSPDSSFWLENCGRRSRGTEAEEGKNHKKPTHIFWALTASS